MLRSTVAPALACLLLMFAVGCSTGSKPSGPPSVGGGGGGGTGGSGGSGGNGGSGGGSGSGSPTIVSIAFAADLVSSASDFFGMRVDSTGTASLTAGSPFAAPAPTIGVTVFGTMLAASSNDANGVGGASHVTLYKVDANGVPTKLGDTIVAAVGEITFSPDGKFLYLTGIGQTFGYAVNATAGTLTEIVGTPWQTGYNGAWNPRISPDGKTYCVASNIARTNEEVYCYSRDTTTGVVSSVSEFTATAEPNPIPAFAITPDSKWAISVSTAYNHLDAGELSPTGTRVFTQGTGNKPNGIAISPDGTLVVTPNSGSNDLSVYRFDTSSGKLTLIGNPIALGSPGNKAAFSSDGKWLYISTSNTVVVFSVNSTDGTVATIKGSPLNTGPVPGVVAAF